MSEEDSRGRRVQRAKQALLSLELAGHDVRSGVTIDIGCGRGYLTTQFLSVGIVAIGVDLSKALLTTARKVAPNGDFVRANGVKLPFKEKSFKTAVLNDVLEHVPYPLAKPLLKETSRILAHEGLLYVSVSNKYQILEPHTLIPFLSWVPNSFGNALCRIYGKPQYMPWGRLIYPYTVDRLTVLCREAGLSFEDYTWFYAWNKVSNVNQIGNPTLRSLAKVIKRLRLTRIAYHVAEKISVILFICKQERVDRSPNM